MGVEATVFFDGAVAVDVAKAARELVELLDATASS